MSELVVNCCNIPFGAALGVSHGLLQICRSLAREHRLTFVANELSDIEDSPANDLIGAIAERTMDVGEATGRADELRAAIELLPHHFQPSRFCDRSIAICYDLHVFDVAWKYGDRASGLQEKLRRVLTGATAVTTPFPRTYYAVEQIAGINLMNLFLTESPLLLDTSPALTEPSAASANRDETVLLYPAQLQSHKNHQGLIQAFGALDEPELAAVRMICPGSDFTEGFTASLRAVAEQHRVAGVVEFPGRVSDDELIELYRQSDAVIVPSLAEGGAYVALEAIAAGKPVAANDIDSARMHAEAMQAEVIWFDAENRASTVDAVRQLLRADRGQWFDRNRRCRDRIASMTWDDVAVKWNVIIDMLEARRTRPVLRTDRFAREVEFA